MIFFDYETPTGFKFQHLDVEGEFLFVESDKLPQTLEFIRAYGPIRLALNPQHGFKLRNLDFLRGIEPLIKGLAIVDDTLDLHGLEQCVNLHYLQLPLGTDQPLDFSQFPQLNHLRLHWKRRYSQVTFPSSLVQLHLWGYPSTGGFNEASLANLRGVTNLSLVKTTVEDLSLLQHCGPLVRVDVAYAQGLHDISALALHADTLRWLELEKCKKIKSFSPLDQLSQLQWLNLIDCQAIPSVSFVQQLPALKHFVFRGTVVEDGNLSFLKDLKQVVFNNKPHYSLKQKDFEYDWSYKGYSW